MKTKNRSLRQRLQDAMSTPNGQIVMNYAYNWGASVVILGTLFKLTHLPGANIMLFAGMGTEVLIFFLSAFDLSGVHRRGADVEAVKEQEKPVSPVENGEQTEHVQTQPGNGTYNGPSVVFVGGNSSVQPAGIPTQQPVQSVQPVQPVQSVQPIPSVPPVVNKELEDATAAYLEQLKSMTDMLARCTAQASSFTQSSDQIANLGRTLSGINALYEMQLRTVSTQIGTVDQVHEQTCKMAGQIEELNEVYARMLQAMTSGK